VPDADSTGAPRPRPNVVLIMADALRQDALGCYGNPIVRTPNIDRLAQGGVRFDRAYVTTPFCSPARASVLTGRWPHAHGLWDNGVRWPHDTTTLATVLDAVGYRTGIVGKGHLDVHYNVPDSPDHVFGWEDPARAATMTGRHYYGFREQARTCAHSKPAGHYGAWLRREHPEAVRLLDRDAALEPPVGECWKSALPVELHSSTYVGDRAVEFIDRYDRSRYTPGQAPFFLFASFPDPHGPYCPPRPYADLYDPAAMPPPLRRRGETRDKPPHFRGESDGPYPSWRPYGAGQRANEERADGRDQILKAYYYAMTTLIDVNVGRIVAALERTGQLDNTVLVFISDHGHMLGDHWTDGYAVWHYDGSVRVPLIVQYPAFLEGGRVASDFVSQADFAPTICELTGVPYTTWPPRPDRHPGGLPEPGALPDVQGRSLLPLLLGTGRGRSQVMIEYESRFIPGLQLKTLRTAEHRLTVYAGRPYGELYDLRDDPDQFINRWDDPAVAAVRADLTARLLDEVIRTESRLPPRIAPN
jgi:arylsulfatase A-like enzyme